VKAGHRAPRARSTATVSYGSKSVVSGRLRNAGGQPIVGARMVVGTAVDRGVPQFADVAADVVTDSDGRFKLALPAGPSLRVRVSYFARALDATPAGRDSARVKVRSKATLRPVHRHLGSRVRATFRGRVLGRFRPSGIRVELQGRRGRSYVTLATAATKPDGSYRVTYRFTHRAHGRYVFRLRVRHYPRFPYFLGYSRATSVTVR
jgi:5-hydroxyisourate hydrolase-like protein (transthyretin family)